MQLGRKVVFPVQENALTNDARYANEDSCSSPSGALKWATETMQESLGLQPIQQMAESLPVWRRLYMQWSKQLSQI